MYFTAYKALPYVFDPQKTYDEHMAGIILPG